MVTASDNGGLTWERRPAGASPTCHSRARALQIALFPKMSRHQRIELLLFIACFFAFAYFNQGGGWNQNARFAEVRAMVEEGRFAIDDFLVYEHDPNGDDLLRIPVENAEYSLLGKRFRLCWVDMEWTLFPVGDRPLGEGVEKANMVEGCSSGDIGYVPWTGHFHPNKPPGTSFLALPGYWVIWHVERWLGINPDRWWTLDLNAWLTSVCSVALSQARSVACSFFGSPVNWPTARSCRRSSPRSHSLLERLFCRSARFSSITT